MGGHRDADLRDGGVGRDRVVARPVAAHPCAGAGRHHPRHGGRHLPGGGQVRSRGPPTGYTEGQYPGRTTEPASGSNTDAEGTTVTPSAHALGSVLATGPGFQAPGLEAFYPTPIFTFSIGSLDFAITRITVALWFATLVMIGFLVATVRKPQIVPGKLQFLGESGYSLVRDGIARDVVGPRGLPF